MKKLLTLLLALLLLGSCAKYPEMAADGTKWDENWTMVGSILGVEELGNGFTPAENPTVLAGDELFYATWNLGEGKPYKNAENKDATVYDAQVYVLLAGCKDSTYAQQNVEDWEGRTRETHEVLQNKDVIKNQQKYNLFRYNVTSESNPYKTGASAFAVYDRYAVSVELVCGEDFQGDPEETLMGFLEACHYSAEVE